MKWSVLTVYKIIHSSPELVSTTRTGSQKFWQGHVGNDGRKWYTQTSYWQVNKAGKKSLVQFSDPYEATGKNIGRANETIPSEQANFEFRSMVQKQRDKGYTEIGVKSEVLPLPMLAEKFKDRGHKITWPAYVQRKYNGQRMLFDGWVGWSRGGKYIIPEVIQHLKNGTTLNYILDGELILPNNLLLQETMKASKKYTKGLSDQLLYIVYDIVIPNEPFSKRLEILKKLMPTMPANVKLAETYLVHDVSEVATYQKQFTAAGYEGTMIRDDSGGYEIGHRSNQLQKLKDFVDAEFKIVGVKEGSGRFAGAAIFSCDNGHGQLFDCVPEGTMEYKRELFNTRDSLIGKYLTIRYQELSRDSIPIFPVGVSIRDTMEDGF